MFVVIPTYTKSEQLEHLALEACRSYRKDGVKVVICEDGQMYSEKLREECDFYIYNKENVGFTKNVNRGWAYALANGAEYVAIVNSDTSLNSGNLRDLCIPDKVTSPKIKGYNQFWGCFWVTPRSLSDRFGLLNEKLINYYSDTEYSARISKYFVPVESVIINHHGAESVREANLLGKMENDKIAYDQL